MSSGFWDEPKKAETLLKVIQETKTWTEVYLKAKTSYEDLAVMWEFFVQGDATEADLDAQFSESLKSIEKLEFKKVLKQ